MKSPLLHSHCFIWEEQPSLIQQFVCWGRFFLHLLLIQYRIASWTYFNTMMARILAMTHNRCQSWFIFCCSQAEETTQYTELEDDIAQSILQRGKSHIPLISIWQGTSLLLTVSNAAISKLYHICKADIKECKKVVTWRRNSMMAVLLRRLYLSFLSSLWTMLLNFPDSNQIPDC